MNWTTAEATVRSPFEDALTTPAAATSLDADEERVTRAQRLLVHLGAALVACPFDTGTHEKLRAFHDEDAEPVLASFAALGRRPEAELRSRIAELAGHTLRSAGGPASNRREVEIRAMVTLAVWGNSPDDAMDRAASLASDFGLPARRRTGRPVSGDAVRLPRPRVMAGYAQVLLVRDFAMAMPVVRFPARGRARRPLRPLGRLQRRPTPASSTPPAAPPVMFFAVLQWGRWPPGPV